MFLRKLFIFICLCDNVKWAFMQAYGNSAQNSTFHQEPGNKDSPWAYNKTMQARKNLFLEVY